MAISLPNWSGAISLANNAVITLLAVALAAEPLFAKKKAPAPAAAPQTAPVTTAPPAKAAAEPAKTTDAATAPGAPAATTPAASNQTVNHDALLLRIREALKFGNSQQVRDALSAMPRPRVVVGASLGGLLALHVAEATDAVVLVNPLPPAPWHSDLIARTWPDIVPWHRQARLDSTRRALPDADEATALFAFRHWRDESGAVLRHAYAGDEIARPACPVLFVLSQVDDDVPPSIPSAMAAAWSSDVLQTVSPSHVGPLLDRHATGIAAQAVEWLNHAVQVG